MSRYVWCIVIPVINGKSMRTKFKVEAVTVYGSYPATKIELCPVVVGSEENERFYKSTPTGKLEMTVKNNAAREFFQPGKEFYIDFIEA